MRTSEKPVLAIETTGSLCSVSIYESDRKNLTISLNMEKAHSKMILTLIDLAMKSFGITVTDLAGVCVSEGPGSFTGLRLGFAAAKGIPLGQNFGIITDITETEVKLKELVPDSLGDYMERTSTLQLQEKQQPEGRK